MIELIGVNVGYGRQKILDNVSIQFEDTDFACILGRNGAGKSTLLRAMDGIQKYSGTISVDGRELSLMSANERAKRIAYMPQIRQIPMIQVKTLIEHGRFPYMGFSRTLTKEDETKVLEAAEITSVEDLLHRNVAELSGGERQRVYLAMVIAQDAKTILLDEPAAYLDISHQLEIMNLLTKLNQGGKNIIMAAHDLPQAFTYANTIKILHEGEIVIDNPPQLICKDERMKHIFGVSLEKSKMEEEVYPYHLINNDTTTNTTKLRT